MVWLLCACRVPDITALINLQAVKLNLVVGAMDQIKNLQGLSKSYSDRLIKSPTGMKYHTD